MASDFEPERSPEARAIAEEALLRLLVALEGEDVELVVLGGLVPEILTRGQAEAIPTHLGTTDVDIHISFGVDADRDLSSLEHALEAIGAEPDPKIDGWRWRIRVGGVRVKIEFLCDRNDVPADQAIALPGCRVLTAANLRGTGFVARDWRSGHLARVTGEIAESVAEIILEECHYSLFWQITAPGMHGVDLLFITPDNAVLALEVIGNTSTRHDPASHSVASAPDEPRLAQ